MPRFVSAVVLRLLLAVTTLALAACASTSFVSQWTNDQLAGRKFERVLVVGVVKDASLRRLYEDEFVRQAQARGITAIQSYRYVPDEGVQSEAQLDKAVAEARADAVLVSVVKSADRQTTVSPGFYSPPPFAFGYYGFYSYGWGGAYVPPRVVQYDVIYVETQLHAVKPDALAWSGTTRTTDPSTAAKEIPPFVTLILNALVERKLV